MKHLSGIVPAMDVQTGAREKTKAHEDRETMETKIKRKMYERKLKMNMNMSMSMSVKGKQFIALRFIA